MHFEGFQKLVTRNLEFNNKSVEETLLEVGKWALLSLRIPGYFPLTICRSNSGKRLELVRCSTVTFYTVFVTILTICGNAFFYYNFIKKFFIDPPPAQQGSYGNTTSFIWFSLMVLVTYTTYLRFSRIFFCRGSLKFWQKTVALMETMVASGYQLSSSHFHSVLTNIRSWVIFYFTISAIRITYGCYWLYLDFNDSQIEISASVLDIFLALTLCFHVGYSVWLTFLVQIITICYETIHEDLNGMCCIRHQRLSDSLSLSPLPSIGLGYYSADGSRRDERRYQSGFIQLEKKIDQTLKTYETIEDHMHNFNRFFGVTLIFETSFALIILVVDVYAGETSIMSDPIYTMIGMGTPIVLYASALFHFSSDSAILSGRAVGVLKKLERFFIPNDRAEFQALQLKVIALIARVADNPPTISAAHFFTMNRHLLTSVLGTITTYLIVLLQFRASDDDQSPTSGTPTASPTVMTGSENCPTNLTWICYCGKYLKQLKKQSQGTPI